MPTLAPIRSLSTSLPIYYPRIRPQYARDPKDAKTGDQSGMEETPEEIFVEETGSESASEETSVPFHEMVTSVCTPRLTDETLADDLKPLHHHLLMSFLPKNQPYTPSINPTKPLRPSVLQQGQWHSINLTDLEDMEDQSPPALPHAEPVLALVSPFEGGRHYVSDAVQRVASKLDADVLKFDLALGLGIDGPASPLGQAGEPSLNITLISRISSTSTPQIGEPSHARLCQAFIPTIVIPQPFRIPRGRFGRCRGRRRAW